LKHGSVLHCLIVVVHSRFVVQPQKSDGDQMKCQCEEPFSRSIVEERRDRSGSYGFNMFSGKEDYRVLLLWNTVWLSWIQFGDEQVTNEVKTSVTYFLKSIINEDCKISLAVYEVERLLYRIKRFKPSSPGLDNIPRWFYHNCSYEILPMWLHIFWICPFTAALYLCSGDKR